MSEELRTAVKVESAKRGLTIAVLFEEIWRLYLTHQGNNEH